MKDSKAQLPIGIFDSGIGGISVLAELIKILPKEKFIYYADTLNTPYGIKSEETIQSLTIQATNFLSFMGIKSLVVACNTATSVAIDKIRNICTFPVIGMEPAIKTATKLDLPGKIIIMATPLTLGSKKFNSLACHYKHVAEIIPFPCTGLVEIIEEGYIMGYKIERYLANLFSSIRKDEISAIVLGCTHYILIKKEITKITGSKIPVIDGNYGTAKHLEAVLKDKHLLNNTMAEKPLAPLKANIQFYTSKNEKKEETLIRFKQLLFTEGIICE
ncbi:MAG: glutamate racemase [Candidatus Loosdrechtia sp.]|uniref:glutamate racemase n=1 Tax=Candidatus Loosdrechtia sp. TaxID=3101272 RepID=UPI003A659378|nr:MAG: glutamate racemase [Candidatus Jettenia sp. AMX2]